MVKIIFFILFLACNLLKTKVPVINEKLPFNHLIEPIIIKMADSKPLFLVTASILGQPPSAYNGHLISYAAVDATQKIDNNSKQTLQQLKF